MCFRKMFLFLILALPFVAFAQHSSENAPEQQSYSGKQDQKWEAVQAEVMALKGKMEMQATVVQNLITEKDSLTGEKLQQKLDQIKTEHKKYERLVVDYNSKNEEFMTRYPERGLKEKRIYKRAKVKSLDSFEDDVTVRGRMNKLHKKVLRQYPRAFKDEKNKKESTTTSEPSNSASDDVTNAIKVKK